MVGNTFAAVDFETADRRPESACAVGVVRVVDGRVEGTARRLIRSPPSSFRFARWHGIVAADVRDVPAFGDVWRECTAMLRDIDFVCAHYAPFELRVLHTLCPRFGLRPPAVPFVCTSSLAAELLGRDNARLDRACRCLEIPLRHHDPLSDAKASAAIALVAMQRGVKLPPRAAVTTLMERDPKEE